MQEAQEAADKGTPAIGISEDRIVVLSANDEEQPVAQTASVMTLDENTPAYAVDGLQYYSYGSGSGTSNSHMTSTQYYNNILATPLQERSPDGTTYCNLWAQAVLRKCGISYPTGGCTSMLNQFTNGFSNWLPLNNSQYKKAQEFANSGYATVAITPAHIAVVTPNNISSAGSIPSNIGQVLVSQSGWDSFYRKTLSWAWTAAARGNIRFFYYNG